MLDALEEPLPPEVVYAALYLVSPVFVASGLTDVLVANALLVLLRGDREQNQQNLCFEAPEPV